MRRRTAEFQGKRWSSEMAKLSTTYHECSVTYVDANGAPVFRDGRLYHCPFPAYRKDAAGKWLCRKHMRRASKG